MDEVMRRCGAWWWTWLAAGLLATGCGGKTTAQDPGSGGQVGQGGGAPSGGSGGGTVASGGGSAWVCIAGSIEPCTGEGDCSGTRVCDDAGSGYGPCRCLGSGGTPGEGGTAGACLPGDVRTCTCPGGQVGVQVCLGDTWGVCDCGAGGSGGGAGVGGGSLIPPTGGTGGGGAGGSIDGSVDYDPAELEACATDVREAAAVPSDLFIMLDTSLSMDQHRVPEPDGPTRWEMVSGALEAFVQSPEASGLSAGLQYFPLPPHDATEVVSCDPEDYVQPDVEIGLLPGNAAALVQSIDAQHYGELTPSYPSLLGALTHARQWAVDHPGRPTAVVFMTDGFPTVCDPMSVPSLIDLARSYAYPTDGLPRVPTFVVGLGIGAENLLAPNLDNVADAGGTGSAYLASEEGAAGALSRELLRLARSPLSCELELPVPPEGQVLDLGRVNLRFTPLGGTGQIVGRVGSRGDCDALGGGWYYDDEANPSEIHVCPSTCGSFAGGVVEILVGCASLYL